MCLLEGFDASLNAWDVLARGGTVNLDSAILKSALELVESSFAVAMQSVDGVGPDLTIQRPEQIICLATSARVEVNSMAAVTAVVSLSG